MSAYRSGKGTREVSHGSGVRWWKRRKTASGGPGDLDQVPTNLCWARGIFNSTSVNHARLDHGPYQTHKPREDQCGRNVDYSFSHNTSTKECWEFDQFLGRGRTLVDPRQCVMYGGAHLCWLASILTATSSLMTICRMWTMLMTLHRRVQGKSLGKPYRHTRPDMKYTLFRVPGKTSLPTMTEHGDQGNF